MSRKNKNFRQCINCKKIDNKQNLIRITKDYKTDEVKLNMNSLVQGRSVYICKNAECLENALKKKKIENSLKTKLPENLKDELDTVLNR